MSLASHSPTVLHRGVAHHGLAEVLHRWWDAYRETRARRRTFARLSQLDDRTLQDIGISRYEVGSIVEDRRTERLRRYEEGWWKPFED